MAHKEAHGEGQEHGMILTEEEAKTKRCQEGFGPGPMSQEGNTHIAVYQAGAAFAQITSPSYCIGGKCMAWQWHGGARTIDGFFVGYCGKARS